MSSFASNSCSRLCAVDAVGLGLDRGADQCRKVDIVFPLQGPVLSYRECRMPSLRDELELVRIVAAAIERHARGDVQKLALSIITELRRAGLEIVRQSARTAASEG
jgi:hypothetical protein